MYRNIEISPKTMRVWGERKEVGGQSEGKSAVPGPVIAYNPEQDASSSSGKPENVPRVWVTKAFWSPPQTNLLREFFHTDFK